MVMLWTLTPFLMMLVVCEVTGVGVPSTRAQAPTVLFQPRWALQLRGTCV